MLADCRLDLLFFKCVLRIFWNGFTLRDVFPIIFGVNPSLLVC